MSEKISGKFPKSFSEMENFWWYPWSIFLDTPYKSFWINLLNFFFKKSLHFCKNLKESQDFLKKSLEEFFENFLNKFWQFLKEFVKESLVKFYTIFGGFFEKKKTLRIISEKKCSWNFRRREGIPELKNFWIYFWRIFLVIP